MVRTTEIVSLFFRSRNRSVSTSDLGLPFDARITHYNFKFPAGSTVKRFKVGSGDTSDNPPLHSNTKYQVFYVVRSSIPEANSAVHTSSVASFKTKSKVDLSWKMGVFITVATVTFVIFTVILIFKGGKRRRQRSQAAANASTQEIYTVSAPNPDVLYFPRPPPSYQEDLPPAYNDLVRTATPPPRYDDVVGPGAPKDVA